MRLKYSALALIITQSVQSAPNPETVIRLQVASMDTTKASALYFSLISVLPWQLE
jgi:hypothetical protein